MPIWVDEGRFPQGGDTPSGASSGLNLVQADSSVQDFDARIFLADGLSSSVFLVKNDLNIYPGYILYSAPSSVTSSYVAQKLDNISEATLFILQAERQRNFTGLLVGLTSQASSFCKSVQLNPGVLPYLTGIYSDLYTYDIASRFRFVDRLSINFIEKVAPTFFSTEQFAVNKNLVSTDYYTTISGGVDECLGDGEPPFITLYSPTTSGIHLRPRTQIVDFSLTDAVGGVDLSTISVNVIRTSVSGSLNIVQNGIDQTGGDVSVVGSQASYRFTYVPPTLWDYNEKVLITISGTDLPPEVDGNPFFCGVNSVNTFIGDIPFQILNFDDFTAEVTVLGDTDPPYVEQLSPGSGTTGNSVFTSVSLHLKDNLTGVDLSNVVVSIGSIPIINNGVPTNTQTTIVGSPNDYIITYTPITAFSYGSTILVEVASQDRAYPTPNTMYTFYTFECIGDSTLVISDFKPAVGTHVNPEDIDVVVDVTDAFFGIDSAQTFFVINGTIVSGTRSSIPDGYRLTYHPPNDFAFNEPMRVTVHGTNSDTVAPIVKESFYSLFYGCRVFLFNETPYNHFENVDVFVRARNNEQLHKDLTTGYFFTTYTQPQANLGASIEGITPYADLLANLSAVGPEHRYGETVTVEFSVEDFDGRILGPYTYTYTIENRPE